MCPFSNPRFFLIRSPASLGGEYSFPFVLKMRNEWASHHFEPGVFPGVAISSFYADTATGRSVGMAAPNYKINRNSGYAKKFRENPHLLAKYALFAHSHESGPREIAYFQPKNRTFSFPEGSCSSLFSGSIRRNSGYAKYFPAPGAGSDPPSRGSRSISEGILWTPKAIPSAATAASSARTNYESRITINVSLFNLHFFIPPSPLTVRSGQIIFVR